MISSTSICAEMFKGMKFNRKATSIFISWFTDFLAAKTGRSVGEKKIQNNYVGPIITVFDLISVLFAYGILGQKNRPNWRTPPFYFLYFIYFVCVYPGCKTLLPKIVACEGPLIMMTGSL